jgi:hypothetical protein
MNKIRNEKKLNFLIFIFLNSKKNNIFLYFLFRKKTIYFYVFFSKKKVFIFKLTTPALVLVKQIKSVSQKMVLKNAIIAPQTAQLVLMKYLPVSPVQKIII